MVLWNKPLLRNTAFWCSLVLALGGALLFPPPEAHGVPDEKD